MMQRTKIDDDMKGRILQQYRQGVPATKLAETYNCGVSTVYAWAKNDRNKQDRPPVRQQSVKTPMESENRHLKELLLIVLKQNLNLP